MLFYRALLLLLAVPLSCMASTNSSTPLSSDNSWRCQAKSKKAHGLHGVVFRKRTKPNASFSGTWKIEPGYYSASKEEADKHALEVVMPRECAYATPRGRPPLQPPIPQSDHPVMRPRPISSPGATSAAALRRDAFKKAQAAKRARDTEANARSSSERITPGGPAETDTDTFASDPTELRGTKRDGSPFGNGGDRRSDVYKAVNASSLPPLLGQKSKMSWRQSKNRTVGPSAKPLESMSQSAAKFHRNKTIDFLDNALKTRTFTRLLKGVCVPDPANPGSILYDDCLVDSLHPNQIERLREQTLTVKNFLLVINLNHPKMNIYEVRGQ